jgi:type VI secretion system secreted protein Hcp
MATELILVLEGVTGECTKDGYTGKIDIMSMGWGLTHSSTVGLGTGLSSGQMHWQDISIVKYVDKASPDLFVKCAKGTHIPSGKIVFRETGGEAKVEYLVLELTEMIITHIGWTGGAGGVDRATESVTLAVTKVKYQYTPQKQDGSADSPNAQTWDIATGTSS